ncbi:hypothetical protein OWR29_10390 [Actinoplanes sp. Pm04-4]|uniref:Transmembrane protein n=1 Tax=Paractinoplanes pyxinae TaxID=2997416 RepID=A0ABT4AYD1_9ACTN|nr:hypothetical protein [Actinoplanes pyxinae]MCY1138405.1 hypothetical protein [Actinoplanes pyxinae]
MSNLGFALEGAWKVLLAGLILGAGLPAIFALGIRSMAFGAGGDTEVDHAAPHPAGRVIAYVLFALVVLIALLGIVFIVASGFGKALSFEHIYPTIVDK